jgi:flagellar hook assembly protein FlgD
MLGQRVITLVDEKVEAGYKTVVWNGTDQSGKPVASGIYFYRLSTESKEIIKRMLLVK